MKKFAGNKTRDQVKTQCVAAGIEFDESQYKRGSDYTAIRGGGAVVFWSSFNGRFFGTTDESVEFASDDASLDGTPWFDALLAFFYTEKKAAKAHVHKPCREYPGEECVFGPCLCGGPCHVKQERARDSA